MKNKRKKKGKNRKIIEVRKLPLMLIVIIFLLILFLAVVYAYVDVGVGDYTPTYSTADFSPSAQYYMPSFRSYYTTEQIRTYWPMFEKEDCKARQDFILTIRPGGCTPTVVRSDLLEEQPVPIFCKVDAIKINPLIDIESIRSISFRGKYPKEVSGTGFHPARAAIRTYDTLLGSPLLNNVGYLVVILKRQPSEKEMPEFVEGNLTALISYDIEKAFGVGRGEFLLPVLTDNEWERNFEEYGFWRGKGFLRANWIETDKASVSIYYDAQHRESTLTLEKGKISEDIYLGGFYCKVALLLKLKEITQPKTRAKIVVQNEKEGEDVLWLYEESNFLDNKCKITSIEPLSLGGSVTIKCRDKEFTLRLGMANSVKLKVEKEEKDFKLWEIVKENKEDKDGKIYFSYVGQVPRKMIKEDEKRSFIVLVKTAQELSEESQKNIERIMKNKIESAVQRERTKDKFKENTEKALKTIQEIKDAEVLFYGGTGKPGGNFSEITFKGVAGTTDKSYIEVEGTTGDKEEGKILEDYFNKAISEYKKVVKLYPAEKDEKVEIKEKETIGEAALEKASDLAQYVGKQKTKQELLRETISTYNGTRIADTAEKELSRILRYDEEEAIETIELGFDYYTFHLQDIVEPTIEEISATISISGEGIDEKGIYTIDDYLLPPTEKKEPEFVLLKSIEDEYVTIEYAYKDSRDRYIKNTEPVKPKELKTLGRFNIYVSDIKLQKIANVVVEPKLLGPYTETNLSFKIGIEKRGIKLSPEKTKEMIENLNESIKNWEDISNKLKNVIKGWKGACYATSAVLLIKNLLDNFSGKSMARQKVMRGAGGWIDKCKSLVETGKEGYASLDDCLRQNNPEIERDVNAAHETIKEVNEMIKAKEVVTKETIFGEKILDTESSFKGFMEEFKSKEGGAEFDIYDPNDPEEKRILETVSISELIGNYETAYKEGFYTFSDVREWKYYNDMLKKDISPEMQEAYKKKLSEIYRGVQNRRETFKIASGYKVNPDIGGSAEFLEGRGRSFVTDKILDLGNEELEKFDKENEIVGPSVEGKEKKQFIRIVTPADLVIIGENKNDKITKYAGKVMLVPLARTGDSYSPSREAYILKNKNGNEVINATVPASDLTKIMSEIDVSRFVRVEKGKCKNAYKNPEVRFYEVEPYKGLPGVVPFDVREGWYVGMKQIIKGFGLTPYTETGLLKNFYLCNVGENGREEFDSGIGDDICTFVSFETGADIRHPCLTETEARSIAARARQAVMDAAQQAQRAKAGSKIIISGQEYKVGLPVGGAEGTQCQDFMSPQDCYIMFNTCDPVLCPPSRCNLAGNYYVRDVVQSGIIGSIALCLPNAREGIFVPVCLTGVHAGIDAYLSILKAHRDCLKESLETGKTVGICDEIRSIYLCEFFWRQFSPLMEIAIPKIVELAYGQGTRGGGEYLTITHAWNTLDNSINYFTNYYAQNAFRAFNIRSTDEVGSEVCKSFISARYPTSKKFFDKLLEPESPVQYHAWFNEILFTEATLPATSHYKVFYHIWAGKDEGAHYSVYLKDPPEISFYAGTPRIIVDTGFISKGGYISETRDFTAPAGYKTLCVRVNLYEECGFGQVSTSFALDYLKEQYVKDQATQEITSEKDCISGTPSLYALAQPNIEEGVEETIKPEMYKRGIIRVCSTDNPGQQTDPLRWKDIGYCDNEKIRCWLDMQSIEDNIKNNATLTEIMKGVDDISKERREELVAKEEVISKDGTNKLIDEVQIKVNEIEKIDTSKYKELKNAEAFVNNITNELNIKSALKTLDDIEERGFLNSQKAKAIYLKGQVYDEITRKIKEFLKGKEKPVGEGRTGEGTAGGTRIEEKIVFGDFGYLRAGKKYAEIYENGEKKEIKIKDFDYNTQMLTLINGEQKKIIKDSKGRVIFEEIKGKTEIITTYEEKQIFKYDNSYLQYQLKRSLWSTIKYLIGEVDKEWMYTTNNPPTDIWWYPVDGRLSFLKGKNFEDGVKEILSKNGQAYNKP